VHHWQDIDAGLAETRRLLRPGGRFLAGERHSPPDAQGIHSHGWTPEQAEAFAEACRTHGFVDVRVEEHHMDRHDVLAVLATAPSDCVDDLWLGAQSQPSIGITKPRAIASVAASSSRSITSLGIST